MIEKEVKVLEIEKKEIIEKLNKLNAKKVFEGKILTEYYDFKNIQMKNKNSILRIRRMGEKSFFEYKEKLSGENKNNIRINEEISIEIDDFGKARRILEKIGFELKMKINKYRTSYRIMESYVEIDEIEGIPTFLEIEGEPEKISKIIDILGLKNKKIVSFNIFELFKYYSFP